MADRADLRRDALTPPLTIVTVVFESEIDLLDLQLRSLARYLDPTGVAEIAIIDNCRRGLPTAALDMVRVSSGSLAPLTRVVPHDQIGRVPPTTGWRAQQLLKLMFARLVRTESYAVLDAKNHFVSPVGVDHFLAPDGRGRVNQVDYSGHPLRAELVRVLTMLDIEQPERLVSSFPATVTPFVFRTAIVLELMDAIAAAGGRSFAEEFVDGRMLEFFLYSGWLLKSGRSLESEFSADQTTGANLWAGSVTHDAVVEALARIDREHLPVLSVHRRALGRLEPATWRSLTDFWVDRGLFPDRAAAEVFHRSFVRSFARGERTRKLHEVRHKWPMYLGKAVGGLTRRTR
jgi:hypothetical protein